MWIRLKIFGLYLENKKICLCRSRQESDWWFWYQVLNWNKFCLNWKKISSSTGSLCQPFTRVHLLLCTPSTNRSHVYTFYYAHLLPTIHTCTPFIISTFYQQFTCVHLLLCTPSTNHSHMYTFYYVHPLPISHTCTPFIMYTLCQTFTRVHLILWTRSDNRSNLRTCY